MQPLQTIGIIAQAIPLAGIAYILLTANGRKQVKKELGFKGKEASK